VNHFIDERLEPVLWFVADWSLRWAVLIGLLAVWLIVRPPRRAAARSLVCWVVLLAGLLLPALPRWGPGFRPPAPAGLAPVIQAERSAEKGLRPAPGDDVMPHARAWEGPVGELAAEVLVSRPAAQPAGEPLGTRRAIVLGLAALWTAGVLVLLARRVGGWLLLERLRRSAGPVGAGLAQLFETCRTELRLRRRATLATHPLVGSPVTLGLLRPTVLVPPTWPDLPAHVQRGGLLHELAHLARYDDWSALLLEGVRVGFFFHPLVHGLLARLERERELLCDEAAVARGIDPRDYARMLLEFARQPGRLLPPAFGGPSYPLGISHRRTVKIRIHQLLEENMSTWRSPLPVGRGVALAAVVLGIGLALGSFRVRALEPAPADAPPVATEPRGGPEEGEKSAPAGYRIEPFHILKIQAVETPPDMPIHGPYLVEPDGHVNLGPGYGKVLLGGLTLDDATAVLVKRLRNILKEPRVSVALAGWVTKWQGDPERQTPYRLKPLHLLRIQASISVPEHPLAGVYLVQPDGTLRLDPHYGTVGVAGMTLDEATAALEKQLGTILKDPRVSVAMAGWEADWHNLEADAVPRPAGQPAAPAVRKEALRYGGRSFDQWRDELLTELKPEVRVEGIRALSTFATNGYGEEALKAILEVVRGYELTLRDSSGEGNVINAAIYALKKMGPTPVGVLVEELKNGRTNGRRFAAHALGELGPNVKSALPALLEAINDEDAWVRRHALQSVSNIDPAAKGFVPALIKTLKDEDRRVRAAAVSALARMRAGGQAAVPALIEAIKDEDPAVRQLALKTLHDLHLEAKAAVPALIKALKDENWNVRYRALELSGRLGAEAKEVVPALIALLKDTHPDIRSQAVRSLGQIGPEAKEAIPALTELLRQEDLTLRALVTEALGKISK
jgi:HEAT repeat protein/beta-lactamase regulating signal transducer with metallopeptidase domain